MNHIFSQHSINSGHLLENLVFTGLRRITQDIFYYRTKNAREGDFLVIMPDRSRMLLQVCESLADESVRKRELADLKEAMAELSINKAFIITRNEEDQIQSGDNTIFITPIWRFLLNT